ncbi:hypothetical protein RJZ56_005026 [Blastomyces dermatitidis]|uniref:Thioesterase domain-containing protein n=3 Tax=Blastomyces TaxID=229219 RepID=A0A179URE1_BLAGS|nr:uncharacterized protein BDBG_06488 [Blastomyces gilchristii SLH14081]XP_045277631.1 uncharacterized protein BDCG_06128 [Blastomyces dermatitidis ER-3]EEQ91008.1 hypothetical protein BDCG_06128 [Blastomyces dermatitidis ER-3]EGE82225.1 hypothetical protein BDDG_05168 [Blastomyces dermatitidis ATCC 18188]OAT10676.1 hypothetical protein BDBG_06488 [Blastomyces gilchristii SLH14081]
MPKETHTYTTYAEFLNNVPVSEDDINFFSGIPCAKPFLNNPSTYRVIPFHPRFDKGEEDTTDRFFSNVINTPETVPRLVAVMRRPELNPVAAALLATPGAPGKQRDEKLPTAPPTTKQNSLPAADPDFLLLLELGPSLSGFRDTVHGGVLATLLDETLSNCVEAFRQDMPVSGGEDRPRLYTAKLQVSFRAPVETPGVIIVKAWFKGVEGRKWFLEGQVVGEDGKVKVEAESLWVMERTTRGKDAARL